MKRRKKECAFNFTGSKRQFLPEVLSVAKDYLDSDISVVDMFCGGASLTTSLPENWKVTGNDIERRVIGMHTYFQKSLINRENDVAYVLDVVKSHCHFHVKNNKFEEGYENLKRVYNNDVGKGNTPFPLDLYTLTCSSNSNRMRWNKSGEWNLQFGKRYFNPSMEKSLESYLERMSKRDITFTSNSFREIDCKEYDLAIIDPPYSYNGKSTAVYNENGGWQYKDMIDTLFLCDKLDSEGKKFIYFNELITKGEPNSSLMAWANSYKTVYLDSDINESSANRTNKKSVEVMIHNF